MGDLTRFWRHPRFDDLCLLKAQFIRHRYELHTHPTYVLAVITQGCERLRIGTRREVAPAGSIIIVHPEECHDGEAGIAEGWSYRTLYPSVALMCEVSRELGRDGAPVFGQRVIDDHSLTRILWRAHQAAEGDDPDEAELAMLVALRMLIMRYAESDGGAEDREHSGARRRFALYADAVDLNQDRSSDLRRLAQLANVTRYQVIRDFKRVTGLTPGAYVRNRRLRLAGRLIEQGTPIVEAALAAGFADQSHLSRSFRSTHGITPRMYRRAYMQEQERLA
jgi:AraC-like DNA-binding protein